MVTLTLKVTRLGNVENRTSQRGNIYHLQDVELTDGQLVTRYHPVTGQSEQREQPIRMQLVGDVCQQSQGMQVGQWVDVTIELDSYRSNTYHVISVAPSTVQPQMAAQAAPAQAAPQYGAPVTPTYNPQFR